MSKYVIIKKGEGSMKYIKCPRCELNYIHEEEELCPVCINELYGQKHGGARNSATGYVGAEKFIIKNEPEHFDFDGLKLYNSKNENVGIAFATKDKCSSDGNLEFHFYSQYENKYGRWHRIRVNNLAVLYKTVVSRINQSGIYEIIVDGWQKFR